MYPQALLPRPDFLPRINLEELLREQNNLYVVRRSRAQVKYECLDNENILSQECIPDTDNIYGFSMNILGGGFDVNEHLRYRQMNRGNDYWDGVHMLSKEDIERSWDKVEAYPIHFLVANINGQKFPYSKQSSGNKGKMPKDSLNEIIVKVSESIWNTTTFTCITRVEHVPTQMNYWHVELRVYQSDDLSIPIKRTSKQWNRTISRNIRTLLRMNSVPVNEVVVSPLPKNYYLKRL